jgi:hypothetical protein
MIPTLYDLEKLAELKQRETERRAEREALWGWRRRKTISWKNRFSCLFFSRPCWRTSDETRCNSVLFS